jgi:hypothetical protein
LNQGLGDDFSIQEKNILTDFDFGDDTEESKK